MANGTIAFDTLSTSGQITGTAKSVDTDYVVNGSAKAWIHYVSTTSTVISDSFNVGSVTDGNDGTTTINFSNNMVNATFSAGAIAGQNETFVMFRSPATNSYVQTTTNAAGAGGDRERIGGHIFGDLA